MDEVLVSKFILSQSVSYAQGTFVTMKVFNAFSNMMDREAWPAAPWGGDEREQGFRQTSMSTCKKYTTWKWRIKIWGKARITPRGESS